MAKILTRWMAQEIKDKLSGLDGGVVVDFTGLNSKLTYSLRTSLREADIKVAVVKNTMARRALSELGFPEASGSSLFEGPSAIVFGGEGPPLVAKTVLEWKKKNKAKALQIKGGFLPGKALDADGVEQLSKVPGRPQVLAMVLGIVQAAARNFVVLSQLAAVQPLYLLRALADKRGGEAGES